MITTYEEMFHKLGLDEKESKVYTAALALQTATATEIAKKSEVSRTTCYGILESLVGKGLVSKTDKSGVLKFNADNPELLNSYIDTQKIELDVLSEEIKKIIPDLKALRKENQLKPEIEFFEGKNAISTAFNSVWPDIKQMAKIGTSIYIHGRTDRVIDAWPGFIKYAKKRMNTGVKIKMLVADEKEDKELVDVHKKQYQIKSLPKKYIYQSGVHIYNEKIILFDFDNSVSVIIRNKSLAQMMRMFFDFMWENV